MMRTNDQVFKRRGQLSRSLRVVCILLIGLILYNPFLGLIHSPAGLSVDHPPRNRATVGASELQHFSPAARGFFAVVSVVVGHGEIVPALKEKEFPLAADASPYPFIPS